MVAVVAGVVVGAGSGVVVVVVVVVVVEVGESESPASTRGETSMGGPPYIAFTDGPPHPATIAAVATAIVTRARPQKGHDDSWARTWRRHDPHSKSGMRREYAVGGRVGSELRGPPARRIAWG